MNDRIVFQYEAIDKWQKDMICYTISFFKKMDESHVSIYSGRALIDVNLDEPFNGWPNFAKEFPTDVLNYCTKLIKNKAFI